MAGRRKGYKKKEAGLETTRFYTDVPVSILNKLDRIAELAGKSKTETLGDLIREAHSVQYSVKNWDVVAAENAKQNEFVNAYILKHFGETPADPVAAQSEALEAFWKEQGFNFEHEEESFILPKIN